MTQQSFFKLQQTQVKSLNGQCEGFMDLLGQMEHNIHNWVFDSELSPKAKNCSIFS